MQKLKTRRAAVKRYKKTANDNYLRRRANKGHLLEKKSSSRKRKLCGHVTVGNTEKATVRKFFNK